MAHTLPATRARGHGLTGDAPMLKLAFELLNARQIRRIPASPRDCYPQPAKAAA